jgi:uncharacterized membrane protein YdjX (TVP38/TMEM64 family)
LSVPRPLLLRFLVLVAVVVTGFAVLRWTPLSQYLTIAKITTLFDQARGFWWAPMALIGAYIVLCPLGVPASPMMIAGGMVFGPLWGTIYNVVGTFLGGVATYFLGRSLGRDLVQHLLGNKLKRAERLISRRGFWGLVGIRFIPIPYPLVNYTAALTGIRPGLFMSTTAIGLIPAIAAYSYFASLLPKAANGNFSGIAGRLVAVIGTLLLLTFIPQVWTARKRRARYRELVERRRARPSPAPPPPPAGRSATPLR